MRCSHTGRLEALLAVLVAGCVISPRPEPPQATLDMDLVNSGRHFGPTIIGDPGAASPAGADVRAIDLDTEAARAAARIEDDGSFEIELEIHDGDVVRLQVVGDDVRSEPIDVLVADLGTTLEPVVPPLGDCLILEPAEEIDLAEGRRVAVDNDCGREVVIEQPTLRLPIAGIEIGADLAWPLSLADGDSVDVRVEAEPGFATEDVFFIEASAPEHDRRPITFVPPP
jgi:hypothetical protein